MSGLNAGFGLFYDRSDFQGGAKGTRGDKTFIASVAKEPDHFKAGHKKRLRILGLGERASIDTRQKKETAIKAHMRRRLREAHGVKKKKKKAKKKRTKKGETPHYLQSTDEWHKRDKKWAGQKKPKRKSYQSADRRVGFMHMQNRNQEASDLNVPVAVLKRMKKEGVTKVQLHRIRRKLRDFEFEPYDVKGFEADAARYDRAGVGRLTMPDFATLLRKWVKLNPSEAVALMKLLPTHGDMTVGLADFREFSETTRHGLVKATGKRDASEEDWDQLDKIGKGQKAIVAGTTHHYMQETESDARHFQEEAYRRASLAGSVDLAVREEGDLTGDMASFETGLRGDIRKSILVSHRHGHHGLELEDDTKRYVSEAGKQALGCMLSGNSAAAVEAMNHVLNGDTPVAEKTRPGLLGATGNQAEARAMSMMTKLGLPPPPPRVRRSGSSRRSLRRSGSSKRAPVRAQKTNTAAHVHTYSSLDKVKQAAHHLQSLREKIIRYEHSTGHKLHGPKGLFHNLDTKDVGAASVPEFFGQLQSFVDVTAREAMALCTMVNTDTDGHIAPDDFDRFCASNLATDERVLAARMERHKKVEHHKEENARDHHNVAEVIRLREEAQLEHDRERLAYARQGHHAWMKDFEDDFEILDSVTE